MNKMQTKIPTHRRMKEIESLPSKGLGEEEGWVSKSEHRVSDAERRLRAGTVKPNQTHLDIRGTCHKGVCV